jgi:hypothetical protein
MAQFDRLLIDDSGQIHSAQSSQLHRRLGWSITNDGRLGAFAVRHLGFVAFSVNGRGAHVWLCPQTAAPRATIAMREQLRLEKPARVLLTTVGNDGESSRLVPGWQEAAMAIAKAASEGNFKRRDAHLAELRDTAAIAKFPVLQELFRQWSSAGSDGFLAALPATLEANPGLRLVLADCNLANGTSLIARMGGAFTAFEDTWLRMASGLRVQDQADYSYGLWIADTYASVAASGTFRIDDVDIEIKRPQVGLIRSRYRRLLLPITTGRPDRVTIVSANVLDRTIDLRVREAR